MADQGRRQLEQFSERFILNDAAGAGIARVFMAATLHKLRELPSNQRAGLRQNSAAQTPDVRMRPPSQGKSPIWRIDAPGKATDHCAQCILLSQCGIVPLRDKPVATRNDPISDQ